MTKAVVVCLGIAVAMGGALAGDALGSASPTSRGFGGASYQVHDDGADWGEENRALPDHYPLVTRNGVVPVEQLSERGLFRQRCYQSFAATAYPEADINDHRVEEPEAVAHSDQQTTGVAALPPPPAAPPSDTQEADATVKPAQAIQASEALALR